MSYKCYLSLHVEQKKVSQKMTSLSNRIQLGQRGVSTLRKTLNEVESQISDLDTAKEIAKKGNQCEREVNIEWRKNSQNGKKKRRKTRVITMPWLQRKYNEQIGT